jgi:tetratricopeptide (TPR) repeat protein
MGYRSRATVESASKAIEYLEKAVAIDSTFAEAYAGLAFAYSVYAWVDILPADEAVPKAKRNIDRALELDPNLPEALGALADYKYTYEGDSAAAEELFERTFELNPNLAAYHNSYAFFLAVEGDCEKAVKEAKLASMLDPLNSAYAGGVGIIFHDCFMLDSALVYLDRTLAEDSTESYSYRYRSSAYATKGMYREALRDVERAAAASEHHKALLAAWYVNMGDTIRAKRCFREMLALAPRGFWGPATLAAAHYWLGARAGIDSVLEREKDAGERAFAYCCLGRVDKAFTVLESTYVNHPRDVARRINSPKLVFLKRDPRYEGLLMRAGIKQR